LSTEKDLTAITAPADTRRQIEGLVQRFARNLDVYTRPDYKETQVRVEFIDPFFEALGWDVRNVQGYAEPYKDVVHEDAIKVSGATKAPDYCFRVGGVRKFFLEAKKPSVPVKGEVGPAYQLRRYAWSAKLPLSILTDFQEFAVYDCRQRPKPTDKAGVGRVLYYTFDQYLDRLDEIYSIFARESVFKGSFDRYVLDTRGKRGTGEVDVEFLKEIEGWRDELARNIALRNPALSVYELNFAVQRTIDRIIFLRMCEDRGIEGYGRLLGLTAGPHIYARMGELYREADEKYNSDLFDFKADTLTKSLAMDDKTLKPILAGLYYPDCPYEFSVLPTEILGQVYEQFLGKVIRLTAGHRAKVEEKPEVKKAGGVYYTPSYIVQYIVEQTVGRLIEGKTPQQISKLRILDPACGSGSFLLGAYQRLLDYHRLWYEEHDPQKLATAKRPTIYQGRGGEWRLTTGEKKRILLNNIYGVDIDRQAVEVTKLSLLLKVLEGENQETLSQQLKFWRERALPDLGENIKCGNSLIGPDYFQGQLMPNEEEMRRVNPFDWEKEFPEMMKAGGFDVVIGNPPYIFARDMKFTDEDKQYYYQHYTLAQYQLNTYALFIEASLNLTRADAMLGVIVPNTWLTIEKMSKLRRFLVHSYARLNIVNVEDAAFGGANVENTVVIARKGGTKGKKVHLATMSNQQVGDESDIPASYFDNDFNPLSFANVEHLAFAISLEDRAQALATIADVKVGLKAYQRGKGKPKQSDKEKKQRVFHSDKPMDESYVPYLQGRDVARYHIRWSGEFLRYGPHLAEPRSMSLFEGERILVRQIPRVPPLCIHATITHDAYLNDINSMIIHNRSGHSLKYLLGLINSRLLSFWFVTRVGKTGRRLFPQFKVGDLSRFPIRVIDSGDARDVARHDRMVALVERMLGLHKKLEAATIPADKKLYQRQIETTDHDIDALVYELYGLTQEEIAIVEGQDHWRYDEPMGRSRLTSANSRDKTWSVGTGRCHCGEGCVDA